MNNLPYPTPEECLQYPELEPLARLENAIAGACHTLIAGKQWPGLDQEWIPSWRLPRTAQGWITYWITAAADELREAISAYRHSLSPPAQLRLLPEPENDRDRSF